jgi:hypothetical protein
VPGACWERAQERGTGTRKIRTPTRKPTKESEMTTMILTARYARYVLTSLATVAFGMTQN